MTNGVFAIISAMLAIAATVLAFIFIVPEKKKERLNKFGKLLHGLLNFKYLIVEKILQALYIFSTAYVFLYGFLMLFDFHKVDMYYSDKVVWNGGYGILIMILGPVIVRLVYELIMMAVLLVKNVITINNKLKDQNGGTNSYDPFSSNADEFKDMFRQTPAQNGYTAASGDPNTFVCPKCGAPAKPGEFCTHCGTKL